MTPPDDAVCIVEGCSLPAAVTRPITTALNAKADRETVEEVRKEVSAIQADMAAQEDFRRKIMLAVIGLGLTNGAALVVAVVQRLAGGS